MKSSLDLGQVPVGFMKSGLCCFGKRRRLTTNVWMKHMRKSVLMIRVMDNWLDIVSTC